jgi:hypothetical protein
MLDEDLADLYGVGTKRLIEQVKRNLDRFPKDFMFQLDKNEAGVLRSRIVRSSDLFATPSQLASSDKMNAFRALSYGEKWRVTRLVAKGGAPDDPGMAAAAVELAERYQRREGGTSALFRWLAILLVLAAGGLGVLAALDGDAVLTIAMALIVLTNVAHLTFNPAARPENVTRSLEASRQVSAARS